MKYVTFLLLFVSFLFSNVEKNNNLIFTKEELTWIKNNPKIKIGVDNNWPPFDYMDVTGQHQGISSEYLNIVSKYTGLKFDIYSDAWVNVLEKIKNKELDLLACAAKTTDREKYLNFTKPYLDVEVVVIGRKDLKLNSFSEIKNYTVAVQKNNYIHEDLARQFPNIKFYFVKSNEEAFKAVSYGKADFYLGNLAVATYFIEKNLLTNLEIKMKSDFQSAKLSVAVLKEKDILFNIFEKVFDNISEEERNKINRKWIFEENTKEQLINFSQEELEWIKQNPVIYLAGDPKWPPFSFYEDGKYVGIIPDMLNLLKEVSGINFQHINTNSWEESVNLLKDEKIKILDAVTITPKMSKIVDFSSKYFSSQIVIIGKDNNERYISSIKDIENMGKKALGLIEGNFITEMIKRDNPDLEIFGTFKDIPEGLKALSSGMIDYFVLDIPTFDYYSKVY
ncbi:MAG: transporter substrate-binding domain-containing protein, partial [Arcobacter sp.]|nr:transporter substrate-binding domain-containing protein [Arcobacter sp.]